MGDLYHFEIIPTYEIGTSDCQKGDPKMSHDCDHYQSHEHLENVLEETFRHIFQVFLWLVMVTVKKEFWQFCIFHHDNFNPNDIEYNSDLRTWEPEFIFLTWQLRETLDNISVAELLSPFWFQICGKYNDIKSNPRDLWPETWLLRHWLHFWQLRTTILTITLWPLKKEWWWQHSQFLRCLLDICCQHLEKICNFEGFCGPLRARGSFVTFRGP